MTDKEYLRRAAFMAEQSPEEVGCGCLIVKDGHVVASQFNSQKKDGMAINHAELKAVVAANYETRNRELEGATAYCSCEPCAMCLAALSYAKVERIVYSKTMAEVVPDDPQAKFDSKAFVKTLNFVPKLEKIKL
jgi:tRNA(Arg) A34 adenosine deaminase TadA